MHVYIERTKQTQQLPACTASELLEQLKINPEEVLVTRNDVLVTGDVALKDDDEIKVLSVISGG